MQQRIFQIDAIKFASAQQLSIQWRSWDGVDKVPIPREPLVYPLSSWFTSSSVVQAIKIGKLWQGSDIRSCDSFPISLLTDIVINVILLHKGAVSYK